MATILIIDDVPANRFVLKGEVVQLGHIPVLAENGREAWEILPTTAPDLILCDILMPEMDGKTFLTKVKDSPAFRLIPIVMISALDDMDSILECLEKGAEDFLAKPFNPLILKARIDGCLQKKQFLDEEKRLHRQIEEYNRTLEERVRLGVKKISAAQMETIFALSKLAESRDPETGAHLERMRRYCTVLAEYLRTLPRFAPIITDAFIENLFIASPLHDIGKVGIPDRVLLKPGKLDTDEFTVMKAHCLIGSQTLRDVQKEFSGNVFVDMGIMIAEGHHEKWDGSGYPRGLAAEDIPLPARILALGDVYDALTSKRCYKEAFSHEKSRDIILSSTGTHFDPLLVEAFLKTEAKFIELRRNFQD